MRTPVLGRRLSLEAPERVADGAGGFVETWGALGVLWAEVAAARGRAVAGDGGPVSRVPWRVTVRAARPGSLARPVAGQRFREGERVFNILSVAEADAGGRYLICETDEETAA